VGRRALRARASIGRAALLLVAAGAILAACARPDDAAAPRTSGPPPRTASRTATPTPAIDTSPAALLARAVCWLDDPSKGAACLPPAEGALEAIRAMGATGDRRFVAPLVDMRALDVGWADQVTEALAALTGQRFASDAEWYRWLAANPQPLPPDYARWKGRLLALIDPAYASIFGGAIPAGVRPELVMWSGLRPGELPRLNAPATTGKDGAGYLEGGDTVFALQLGGVTRAYPARILTWHPVVHDQVGGVAVVVTYCGPCASASAFAPSVGGRPLRLRDAGLWLDGRPLLLDEQTGTVWDGFVGRAVLGPLAAGGVTLDRRPLVTAPWGEWLAEHPSTSVLALETGFARDYSVASRRARDATLAARFPSMTAAGNRLPPDTRVLGLVAGNEARAYVLAEAREKRIVLDTLGGERFLLLSLGRDRAVRVYRPGALTLRELRDDFTALGSDGRPGERWWVQEQAIVSQLDGRTHEAAAWVESTWAAWSAAYPQTSIWGR
jgi:hypothetical protein